MFLELFLCFKNISSARRRAQTNGLDFISFGIKTFY